MRYLDSSCYSNGDSALNLRETDCPDQVFVFHPGVSFVRSVDRMRQTQVQAEIFARFLAEPGCSSGSGRTYSWWTSSGEIAEDEVITSSAAGPNGGKEGGN